MARLLLLLLLGGVIFLLLRALRRTGNAKSPPVSPPKSPESAAPATMVACVNCGVHVPEPEALVAQGRHYCCEAHRRLGPARQ